MRKIYRVEVPTFFDAFFNPSHPQAGKSEGVALLWSFINEAGKYQFAEDSTEELIFFSIEEALRAAQQYYQELERKLNLMGKNKEDLFKYNWYGWGECKIHEYYQV